MNAHTPGIGHNIPLPPPPIDGLDKVVADALALYETDARARLAEVPNVTVTDEDSAGLATTLGKLLNDFVKDVDKKRTEIKQPYLESGRYIDNGFRKLSEDLTAGVNDVKRKIGAYQEELRRKAAAEAAQRQKEADEAAAAARRAEAAGNLMEASRLESDAAAAREQAEATKAPEPIRSAYGHTASARKSYVATIDDYGKAYKAVKDTPVVREAIQKAVDAAVRAGNHNIPGVTVTESFKTALR